VQEERQNIEKESKTEVTVGSLSKFPLRSHLVIGTFAP
jgi:hypothetical protein